MSQTNQTVQTDERTGVQGSVHPDVGTGAAPAAVNTLERSRVVVFDGHSMAFRAFYALPAENFSTD